MTTSSAEESESVRVLTGMYAAEAEYLAAGGPGEAPFDLLAPFFAPDVELHQADALPYGGTWCGHRGVTQFFLVMGEVWESFDMVEQEFLATGETAVVLTQVRARARATGRELSFPLLQAITVEDGLITRVRPFYWDTRAIADACAVPTPIPIPTPTPTPAD
ncbi:nuclear transport factor 2 family protein [Streptomyces sp. NPDC056160]|uniref:nuclear transport factor 2 family protein n=1 Tax=Streptomyces sp. NPDC056160 TaxID=3345731 RepID=UPI0035D78F39